LDHLAALPGMLNNVAKAWHRPSPGQPSLKMESEAVGLLICAVEDFTETEFPSPRSEKRPAEIDFVKLLAERLFPGSTPSQIMTMLWHFHDRRLDQASPKTLRPRKSGKL
jgi:hypothetical protein